MRHHKLKNALIFMLITAVVFVTTASAGPVERRTSRSGQTASDVIRQFYGWYIKGNYSDAKKHKTQLRRYVTESCLTKAIKADDYDYFTQAQDGDDSWGINVAVAVQSSTNTRTVALVTLGKGEFIDKLKITLVKQAGTWKIDNVANARS